MLKEFFIKKIIDSKLSALPEEQKKKLAEAISKNPEFLKKVAVEIQSEMKLGKDQMSAAMSVVKKYESELKAIF